MTTVPTPSNDKQPRDAVYWAKQISTLKVTRVPTGALNLNVEGHQVVGGQERLAECHDPHSVLLDGLSCDLGVQAHQAMSSQGGGYQAFIWQVW